MRTITKQRQPELLLLIFTAWCICSMQINGWRPWRPLYQQGTWDRDNQGRWRESLSDIPPSVPACIPLSLCPLQKSVVILCFSVQTGHCGSHLAKLHAAPAVRGERDRCNCSESNSPDYSQWHSFSLALLYLHGAHTSTWKAVYWQGRPGAKREWGG